MTTTSRPSGIADIRALDVMQRHLFQLQAERVVLHEPQRFCRVQQRLPQELPGDRARVANQVLHIPRANDLATAHAGRGPEIEHVIRATDGVLIMLNYNQRVAIPSQLGQRVEEDGVIARMQSNGGLIQHVADALEIRA